MSNPFFDTFPLPTAEAVPIVDGGQAPPPPQQQPYVVPIPIPMEQQQQQQSSSSSSSSYQQQQQQQQQPTQLQPELNDEQISKLLEQGYTQGLIKSLEGNQREFVLKIWIIDNSGSMQRIDGHRIVNTKSHNQVKVISCSRWEEIQEYATYHIQLADLIKSPTSFRLLNNPGANAGQQRFEIATEAVKGMGKYAAEEAKRIISTVRPGGCTPLTNHILEIHHEVSTMAPILNSCGQRVAIIIATDGLPTDDRGYGGPTLQSEFSNALRLLEGLPVWVVIRLCTDEEEVVEFYNNLDTNLELSIEVLDDFLGEAQEIYAINPWLTYGLPIHRIREMGFHDRVFDMIDERQLSKTELRDFCFLLFGSHKFDGVADPNVDWDTFLQDIGRLLKDEQEQWDPITKRMRPWIDVRELNRIYGESACVIM